MSLKKHDVDIVCDQYLCNSDLLYLTETQIYPESSTCDIENILHKFQIEFNCSHHSKFKSLALCPQPTIFIPNHLIQNLGSRRV